jgi:hypothetical protein
VSGKKVDFGPQYIFRRADLDRLHLEKFIKRIPRKRAKTSDLVNAKQAAEKRYTSWQKQDFYKRNREDADREFLRPRY